MNENKSIAGWSVLFVGWFALCGVGTNWIFQKTPLWHGAVHGAALGVGVLVLIWLKNRGLMLPFWPSMKEPRAARERLAKERESLLAAAQAKAESKDR